MVRDTIVRRSEWAFPPLNKKLRGLFKCLALLRYSTEGTVVPYTTTKKWLICIVARLAEEAKAMARGREGEGDKVLMLMMLGAFFEALQSQSVRREEGRGISAKRMVEKKEMPAGTS